MKGTVWSTVDNLPRRVRLIKRELKQSSLRRQALIRTGVEAELHVMLIERPACTTRWPSPSLTVENSHIYHRNDTVAHATNGRLNYQAAITATRMRGRMNNHAAITAVSHH